MTTGSKADKTAAQAVSMELYAALLDSHQILVMLSDQVDRKLRSPIYDQCALNSAVLAKARGEPVSRLRTPQTEGGSV